MFYTERSKEINLLLLLAYELINFIIIGFMYYGLSYYLHGGWKLLVFFSVVVLNHSDWFQGFELSGIQDDEDFDAESDYAFVNFLSLVLVIVILFAYLALAFISLYQGFVGLGVLKVIIY